MGFSLGLLLMLQQPPPPPSPPALPPAPTPPAAIIVDGHIDTPQRMLDRRDDISARLADGHVDIPRMKAGGLTAAFFSIWVDSRYGPGSAFRRALDLISAVKTLADSNRDVELATNAWKAGTRSRIRLKSSTRCTPWACAT